MAQSTKKALVVGATGINGTHICNELTKQKWQVIGTATKQKKLSNPEVKLVTVDWLQREKAEEALKNELNGLTHLYFCALVQMEKDPEKELEVNSALFRNALDVTEKLAGPSLRHVFLLTGTKYYGSHLGPEKGYKTPCRENDKRPNIKYFYYAQEDYLKEKQKGKQWSWSVARPDFVIGFSEGSFMNLGVTLAAYATYLKEKGRPLIFPGGKKAWNCLREYSDADLLARVIVWMSTSTDCANQAFNVTNGELYRFSELWPQIAKYFGMEWECPEEPVKLDELLKTFNEDWKKMADKYKLAVQDPSKMCTWPFFQMSLSAPYDVITSNAKRFSYGFTEIYDSKIMWKRFFTSLAEHHIIPNFRAPQ
jgi:nucleoside-diphosphate-sugar epimerase